MSIQTHAHTHTYAHTHVRANTHTHARANTHATEHTHTRMNTHTRACEHTHTHIPQLLISVSIPFINRQAVTMTAERHIEEKVKSNQSVLQCLNPTLLIIIKRIITCVNWQCSAYGSQLLIADLPKLLIEKHLSKLLNYLVNLL